MTDTIAILAAASAAHAQTWTWQADVANPVLDPARGITTQEVTLSVAMTHDTPYYILGFSVFDTLGTTNADQGHISSWDVLNQLDELTGDLTTTDGVSLYGTNIGQLCVFTICNPDNPLEVLTFTWEFEGEVPDAPILVDYLTFTHEASIWAGDDQDSAISIPVDILEETVISWTVLPAPATIALLPGALIMWRRGRSRP